MQVQRAWLKPGVWGVVVGSILTMIVGFSWEGWMTGSTARQVAMKQTDAAVTAALVPICLAGEKADVARAKKLGELTAITSPSDQTEFVMKTGWATFPGQADPNRAVAEACASAVLKTAAAKWAGSGRGWAVPASSGRRLGGPKACGTGLGQDREGSTHAVLQGLLL